MDGSYENENIPMSFNSWSRRDFSKGRRGVTYVLRQTQLLATGMMAYKCLQNQEITMRGMLHIRFIPFYTFNGLFKVDMLFESCAQKTF